MKNKSTRAEKADSLSWYGGGRMATVVAFTDIPANVTAGPYPGGLDFGARTSDHQTVDSVVKVGWRDGYLAAENDVININDDVIIFDASHNSFPASHNHHHHQRPRNHHDRPRPQPAVERGRRWMLALQPARDRHEQNVEVVAEGGRLVLHVLKPVRRGERLLLWYSDSLARAFGVPILTPAHIRGNQQYTCTSCLTTFQYPNTLKAHVLFRCEASRVKDKSSSSPSPTSPSAFTAVSPLSPFRLMGPGSASAFYRSPASSSSSPSASSKLPSPSSAVRAFFSASVGGRRSREHGCPGQDKVCTAETSHRKTVAKERRSMTPDSSTDGSGSVLNLSTRKSTAMHSPGEVPVPLSIPVCPTIQHSSGNNNNNNDSGSPPNAAMGSFLPPAATGQPIQIFNHIHPPGLPLPALHFPLDQHLALRLCYPWLASLPADANPTKLLCSPSPIPAAATAMMDPRIHHHHSGHPVDFHSQHNSAGLVFPHFLNPHPESLLMTSAAAAAKSRHLHQSQREGVVLVPNVSLPTAVSREACSTRSSSLTTDSSLVGGALSLGGIHPGSNPGKPSPRLPLLLPVPSEKEGEPLDLLPPSFFANKSRKGHLCVYCGKLYSRKYGLKIHLRTHTGYKPLKCKVCLRPFGDPSNLNKHVRLHAEGETPYRCDFCGKVLVRRRDLERHVRSRHPSEVKDDDDVSTECVDSEVDVTSEAESAVDSVGHEEIEVT